ncbi:Phosphonate-transporting ATPase [Syntrophobotulus glycolicus DSM 8271]|uniref:Phosphonate-transporting ATPase n=1 Tax=Syntrophobotulus glycolicus (strain DSM 8271 / FlGlyR) TaxID=645991 RepID=F0T0Y4_SYNGF|nr:ATP-binding cassette domain-containing protein [Syntrophobotulus glycolicus]ADY57355.1 Phosphonate-transporting ATPase [Syntrophobotulus glycolicus DSM 8271]
MIDVQDLSFSYQGSAGKALDGLRLKVEKGQFYGIAGPAGAGKSTFAMCLNGAVPRLIEGDFSGQIYIAGKNIMETPVDQLCSVTGSVFQDVESQLVSSVVEDEIVFGMENLSFSKEEMDVRIAESLAAVGISNLRQANIWSLSGGQKQRVAIASALALRPQLLIMDEPTSELDPQASLELFHVLTSLNRKHGMTIVVIEQKLDLLFRFCDRLAIMDKGSVVLEGGSRDVLEKQDILEEIGLQVPPAARLFFLLKRVGVHHSSIPVSEEEACGILAEILDKGR